MTLEDEQLIEDLFTEAYPTAAEVHGERYGLVCAVPGCPSWTRVGLYCRSHRCRRCEQRAERGRLGYCRTHYTQAVEAGERKDDLPSRILPDQLNLDWMADAACQDAPVEIFFPQGNAGAGRYVRTRQYDDAQAFCEQCPVRAECLEYALATDLTIPYGMFGGATPSQRAELRTSRRRKLIDDQRQELAERRRV